MAMDLKGILIAIVEIQDLKDGNHYSATISSFLEKVKLNNIKWFIIH